ncbi:MAG: DNA repair protein RecN [Pseudomonadota bacterium]|nr:DNA repair protein RecN [Pseudomonadota bacterium]
MLTRIHIRDFAIIEELELELGGGMSVLTGETGAGKSILIDALGLVLGDRAASDAVREGAAKADIMVCIDVRQQTAARAWLVDHDFEAENECWLRRVIARDGRSKAYINGSPAPLNLIRQLGEMLVDIHGQHEHQSLLRSATQRQVLDARADNDERLAKLTTVYQELRALQQRLHALATLGREREDRIDLLRFQIEELTDLNLGADEFDALGEEHRRLAHGERLKEASLTAYAALYEGEEDTLDALIGRIINELEPLRALDEALGEPTELLSGAQVQVREAANELRRYGDRLDIDPERLAQVEARLADIHHLARKHRLEPAQLPAHLTALEAELASLQDPEFDLAQIQERLAMLAEDYRSQAQAIHDARAAAAVALSTAVTDAMQDLGMSGGRFEATVKYQADAEPEPYGLDRIEFQVSGGAGQALGALHKIASGGELSRISLAIQIVAARSLGIPTLIFDEVDAGIGGGVAEAVGLQLRRLSEQRQVMCVTHLPQVAAQAHHHIQVNKRTRKQTTGTQVVTLNNQERVEEIARMLGGLELTDKTRAHAEEMINRARVS